MCERPTFLDWSMQAHPVCAEFFKTYLPFLIGGFHTSWSLLLQMNLRYLGIELFVFLTLFL